MAQPTASAMQNPDLYLIAGSGSVTATGNNTPITALTDQSASPKSVSPSTGANVPTFLTATDTPTPVPAFRFTTANTASTGKAGSFSVPYSGGNTAFLDGISGVTSPRTYIYAYRRRGAGTAFQTLSTVDTGAPLPAFITLTNVGTTDTFERYSQPMGNVSGDTWHILTFIQTPATAGNMTETQFVDGVQVYSGTNAMPTPHNNLPLTIGSDPANVYGLNGDMVAIAVYNRALTTAERQAAEGALSTYTGIAVSGAAVPLAAGTVGASAGSRTPNTLTLVATAASGGANGATLTYQWYRSTTSRGASAPATANKLGAAFGAAAGLTLADTGLTASTNYYYTLSVTDGTTTVYYPELALRTAGNQRVDILHLGNSTDSISRYGAGNTPIDYLAESLMNLFPSIYVVTSNQAVAGSFLRDAVTAQITNGGLQSWYNGVPSGSIALVTLKFGENDCRVTAGQGPVPATTDGLFSAPYDKSFLTSLKAIADKCISLSIPLIVHDPWQNSQDTATPKLIPQYWSAIAGLVDGVGVFAGAKNTENFLTEQGGLYDSGDFLHEKPSATPVLGGRYATALEGVFTPATIVLTAGAVSGGVQPVYANVPNNTLNWSVASSGGAGAASVDRNGVVTLPANFNAGQSVVVTAVSKVDSSKSRSVTISGTVYPVLTINPARQSVAIGGAFVTFALGGGTGTYALDTTIGTGTWNLSGNALTYTPPTVGSAATASVTISSGIQSAVATVNLTVLSASVVVQITTGNTTVSGGSTHTFNATVANDTNNAGVMWGAARADGATGSVGSVTSSDPYTAIYTAAPATNVTQQILLTATSVSDPNKFASVLITILPNQFITVSLNGSENDWDITRGTLSTTQLLPGEIIRLYITDVQIINRDGTPHDLITRPLVYRMALVSGSVPAESDWFPATAERGENGALTILSIGDLDTDALPAGTYRVALEASETNGQRLRKFVSGTIVRF